MKEYCTKCGSLQYNIYIYVRTMMCSRHRLKVGGIQTLTSWLESVLDKSNFTFSSTAAYSFYQESTDSVTPHDSKLVLDESHP